MDATCPSREIPALSVDAKEESKFALDRAIVNCAGWIVVKQDRGVGEGHCNEGHNHMFTDIFSKGNVDTHKRNGFMTQ